MATRVGALLRRTGRCPRCPGEAPEPVPAAAPGPLRHFRSVVECLDPAPQEGLGDPYPCPESGSAIPGGAAKARGTPRGVPVDRTLHPWLESVHRGDPRCLSPQSVRPEALGGRSVGPPPPSMAGPREAVVIRIGADPARRIPGAGGLGLRLGTPCRTPGGGARPAVAPQIHLRSAGAVDAPGAAGSMPPGPRAPSARTCRRGPPVGRTTVPAPVLRVRRRGGTPLPSPGVPIGVRAS